MRIAITPTSHLIRFRTTRWPNTASTGLIIAVRDAALIACQSNQALTEKVVTYLYSCRPKIFKRIALYVLSKNADAAPKIADERLTDYDLIGESWCEDEYAELALAYFEKLPADRQEKIFATIDAMPERYGDRWKENLAAVRIVNPPQPTNDASTSP